MPSVIKKFHNTRIGRKRREPSPEPSPEPSSEESEYETEAEESELEASSSSEYMSVSEESVIKSKKDKYKKDDKNLVMDQKEYHKYLQKIFPSKYMQRKIRQEELEESEEIDDKKKKIISKDDDKNDKINITFSIGDLISGNDDDYYDEDYDSEDYEESETEDEDVEVSDDSEDSENDESSSSIEANEQVLANLKELQTKTPNDRSIEKCIKLYEEDIQRVKQRSEKKQQKQKDKNQRIFRKILLDKKSMNDYSYYEKLELENQKKMIKELREINKIMRIEKPYRMTILESDIPVEYKAAAMKKINSLRNLESGSGEYYKIKNWVDTFMKIPFTSYRSLPVSIDDGVEVCHEFMKNAQQTLNDAVYGLNDAKMQIMQMLGQLLTNPKAIGTAIAIHGPPGTGKTSLVKEGISKILDRPFAFIALGGATDSSFLEGHGYTYEGSTWGKIVQILIESKCMNPVIYFDELDKISDTPRGEEIASILTHLTDTSQNTEFHDKYFAEISFDLSKCLFIFSYNDENRINPILKDRMYCIRTSGYSVKEKTIIANQYLLPRIQEQVKFKPGDIIISEKALSFINEMYCGNEAGVRNMKRCLEIIYTKLNLYRLMKPGVNLFDSDMSIAVQFPFEVTVDIIRKLVKIGADNNRHLSYFV